jgi:hypothetical protein
MSFMSGSYNPSDSFAPMANSFIQAIARSPIGTGLGMGRTGDDLNLAGLMGISDPGAAIALNQILQPLLMQVTGQKYTSAQYSGGTNMYTQMKVGNVLRDQGRASRIASVEDQQGIYNMMEGTSKLMGQKFGRNEKRAAQQFARTMSEALPTLSQYAPDLVEGFFGEKGSATVMSQNMFKGGRYAVDPVTGRRGYSAESAGEITKGVYNRLYGANADISEMSGLTAGKAGAMFDEMQRRGLMPNSSSSRGKNLQGIADQLGTTVADVSKLPDLDSKLREFDASKISDRLKGMSKAVSAMQEVFGEMGEPNAPMTQLVGAIETLTQSSMQGMTPIQMEKMIRNTANTAKVAGIEMPEMFRQMGITAGMADAAGVNRALVPGITNQAILENQASKNRFGGAKAFGMLSSDSLLNLQEQLGVQASRDDSTHDMASIIRAVEVYGHEPEKGSEFEAVYKALKDKNSGGEYEYKGEKKNVYTLTRQQGGVQGFLAKEGKVSASELNSLQYNREANSRIIAENELGTNVGRSNQNLRMVEDLARYSSTTIAQIASDKGLMEGTDFKGNITGDRNSLEISRVASEALVNVEPGEIGAEKAPGVVAAALTRHFASKGVNIGEAEKKAIARMSAGIAEGSEKFATTRGMIGGTVTMQQLASKELFREAQATKAEVEIDTAFQQKFRSEGKQGLMSRVSDFVRKGSSKTEFNDFIATALNYQPAGPMADKLQGDFAELMKSRESFDKVDEGKIRADYFQTRIANATDEEKQSIMAEMVSSKFATEGSKEKEYERFAELGRQNSKTQNEQLKNSFKERNGVSMEEMKDKTGQEVRNIAKDYHSKRTEELAEKLNVSLKVAGVTFKGGSRESELNKAVDEMSKTDGEAEGVDRYERFLDKYSLDSELYAKGGKEGEVVKQKSLEGITRLNKYADAIGQSKDDLLDTNLAEFSVINLDQLRDINTKEIEALELMNTAYTSAQVSNNEQLQYSKTELARLEKEEPDNKSAIAEQKAEVKLRQGLVDTKKDGVNDKLIAARSTQTTLADPDKEKAIKASLDSLDKANKQEAASKTAVEKFAEEIKTDRPELKNKEIKTKKDLMDLIVPSEEQLKYVAERRASLIGMTDQTEIARVEKEIADKIKESGANEGKFNAVTDVNKVEAVLDKLKDLNGEEKQFLKDKASGIGKAYDAAEKEFTEVDKDRLEKLNSKVGEGLSSEETIERNQLLQKEDDAKVTYAGIGDEKDRVRYAELKDREKKKLTVEDEETLKVAEKQLGLKPGEARVLTPGQLRAVEAQRTQRSEKDPAFNQRVKELIKQDVSAEEAKRTALKELGDQDSKMVTAIGGVEGLKTIAAAEKVSLARDASELDIILQDKNTALSPTMAKALEASAKLKSGDLSKNNGATENLTNFFKDNLGTVVKKEELGSVDKTYQANREVGNKLASTINLGGARAAELAGVGKDGKDGKEASPQQRMSELKTLLEKDDKDPKLTEPEKKLRAGLKAEGITKDIFTKDGNIDVKKFNEAAESMGKKQKEEAAANARKESNNVVSLDDRTLKALSNKELVLSGTMTIKGDVSGTAKSATPPPSK